MRLGHQRILVMGGTSGIGLAVAKAVLAEGADVVVSSSDAERVDRARGELGIEGSQESAAIVVDLASEQAIKTFFEGVRPFDHLIYTAGDDLPLGPLAGTNLASAHGRFQVRYWGALAAVK